MQMQRSESGLLMHPRYADALRRAGWDAMDGLVHADVAENLHKPGLPSWRKRARLDLEGEPVYLKTFSRSGGEGRSDAQVEFDWLVELAGAGIAVPTPIAFGQSDQASALLMAQAPGVSLEKWLPTHADRWLGDAALREQVILAVADLARRFHGLGVAHRDFYLAHLFFDDGQPPRITLIDLQRVLRPAARWRMGRWVRKDLAQLNYSTPRDLVTCDERLRFYQQYRGVQKLSLWDRVQLGMIALKTRRIARHDARKQARVTAQTTRPQT